MKIDFFLHMNPPTCTHQEKKIGVRNGKPYTYEPPELKEARAKLTAYFGQHVPERKYTGPVRLTTKWCFPIKGKHKNGEYRTSRPDVTNLQKLFEDVMTDLGYWTDDALIVSAITEKFWAERPGIYVCIEEVEQ